MRGFPSPPVLSGTLSGFVVGVFVTLIASGVIGSRSTDAGRPAPTATIPAPVPVSDAQLYRRIRRMTVSSLGPSLSSPKQSRFVSLQLLPAAPTFGPGIGDELAPFRTVYIVFRLYENPLGRIWRLKSAEADVFALMKALYTSGLPVQNVRLEGVFPLRDGTRIREQTALVAFIDHQTAGLIPWRRWTRKQEGQLWQSLTYKSVDSRFA